MAEQNLAELMRAFALESRLAARAELLAVAAGAESDEVLALTLKAQAASRQVRARRLLRLARGKISRGRERILNAAREDQAQAAAFYDDLPPDLPTGLEHSLRVEKLLPGLLERAVKKAGPDAPGSYAVCQVCGFVKAGDAPERCPICGALRSKFESLP